MTYCRSERRARRRCQAGISLIELLVALVILGFVISMGMRMLSTGQQSYTLQNLLTDMHLNADYSLKRITELLEEAGADLPLSLTILTINASDDISVMRNPNGGIDKLSGSDVAGLPIINVADARPFVGTDSIQYLKKDGTSIAGNVQLLKTGSGNAAPFILGIDTVNHKLYLDSPPTLESGDFVFSPVEIDRYYLKNGNLCLNADDNVLAENIDSLFVALVDESLSTLTGSAADRWANRSFAVVSVTARTGQSGMAPRTVTLSKTIQFKN